MRRDEMRLEDSLRRGAKRGRDWENEMGNLPTGARQHFPRGKSREKGRGEEGV